MICETTSWKDTCKFGQTAVYSDSVRSGDVRLEITVGAPVEFTPSADATTLYDRPLQPVSVYFPVTIKNTPPDVLDTWISTEATNAENGGSNTQLVSDGDIDFQAVSGLGELPLGQPLSVKNGWALATLDGVQYSLSIDGLAGYSVELTR